MTSVNGVRVRSVDFLTPEQLKRKRETDRKSQREIRQRTKAHIESLELKIVELERQNGLLEAEKKVWESQCFCTQVEVSDISREFPPPQSSTVVSNRVSSSASMGAAWDQHDLVSSDSSFPDANLTHTSLGM